VASYESMGEEMGNMFGTFRDPIKGRELVMQDNLFIETVLLSFVNRPLGEDTMRRY